MVIFKISIQSNILKNLVESRKYTQYKKELSYLFFSLQTNFFRIILVALCMVSNPAQAEPFTVSIKSEQWEIPRHGEALLKHAELGRIVKQWMANPLSTIEIRYPGGEEGEIWVQELMDWLVALGVPSTAMNHIPGSSAEDIINLVFVKRKHE